MVELIKKKRDGGILTKDEISHIIRGYVDGVIPEYQIASWLMAIYFNGLNDAETAFLTDAMMHSGDTIDLTSIPGIKIDKHSTGGVGDKTTLVLAPLVAAVGVPVAKMSGRGLGHTGGTLDKLESIPGFNVNMTADHFCNQVKEYGIAICSQNNQLVPADKKLYALRDVTGTVDNISLIASSVMSKKLACGADGIVIDLKIGDGAFIKTVEDGEKLASIMISTAKQMDRSLVAVLTSMEEPLGISIGNASEVNEAIRTLQGNGPNDLTELCLELGAIMVTMANPSQSHADAKKSLTQLLENGKAFEKFLELVDIQGGDVSYIQNSALLPLSSFQQNVVSSNDGYVSHLAAHSIGLASVALGAGRETIESKIDHGAGIDILKKVGNFVRVGDILATMYASDTSFFPKAEKMIREAYTFSVDKVKPTPLIYKVMS